LIIFNFLVSIEIKFFRQDANNLISQVIDFIEEKEKNLLNIKKGLKLINNILQNKNIGENVYESVFIYNFDFLKKFIELNSNDLSIDSNILSNYLISFFHINPLKCIIKSFD
jgi:hypothetical protein